jgi:hypothetical protein
MVFKEKQIFNFNTSNDETRLQTQTQSYGYRAYDGDQAPHPEGVLMREIYPYCTVRSPLSGKYLNP